MKFLQNKLHTARRWWYFQSVGKEDRKAALTDNSRVPPLIDSNFWPKCRFEWGEENENGEVQSSRAKSKRQQATFDEHKCYIDSIRNPPATFALPHVEVPVPLLREFEQVQKLKHRHPYFKQHSHDEWTWRESILQQEKEDEKDSLEKKQYLFLIEKRNAKK